MSENPVIDLSKLDKIKLGLYVKVGETFCHIGDIDVPAELGGDHSIFGTAEGSVVLQPDIKGLRERLTKPAATIKSDQTMQP